MITSDDYIQLKAFARIDGAWLAALWTAGFAFYVMGITNPTLQMAAIITMIATPFFVAQRLRTFRNNVRQGVISFRRSYAYTIHVFFYASLLVAFAQYVYFEFLDQGYLMNSLSEFITSDIGRQAIKSYGMSDMISKSMEEMTNMRPIDYAINMLTMNITVGLILGLPIAAVMQQPAVNNDKQQL